jgi:hypothetical protein
MARSGTKHWRWLFALGSLACQTACDDPKCFAPGKNLDTAYDEGAIGCGCSTKDEEQCIDGVALVCERGRWHAVEDGPCLPDWRPEEAGITDAGNTDAGSSVGEGGPSTQPDGEACGPDVCTEYGYCAPSVGDAGSACRAKRNPAEACSEARVCMSGKCNAGTCQDDRRSCTGTWDTSESFAQVICRNRDCHVCVQSVDETGKPMIFGAVEPASCPCPLAHSTPSVPTDAGPGRDR